MKVSNAMGLKARWLAAATVGLGGACATDALAQSAAQAPASAASTVRAVIKGGAATTGWIDFEFYQGIAIFVPVKVNGHDATAMLNLGARSEIDKTFVGTTGLQSAAGAASGGSIGGLKIQVGALTLQGVDAPVKELAGMFVAHPYEFFLGEDVLDQVALDIDFPNHRLAFRDPKTLTKPAGAAQLPLVKVGVGRSVPVTVDGAAPGLYHVEFGNGSPLMVTRAFAETNKLFEGGRVSQRYSGPTKEPEGLASLSHVAFGGADFRQMPTVIVPDSLLDPQWFDSQLSGVVGLPLLSRYRLIFDGVHDRLYTIANGNVASSPFERDRLGVVWTAGKVVFVSPGSPAQAAGFKPGEQIAMIDGKAPDALTRQDLLAMHYGAEGQIVAFTTSDGEVRQVKLAEYY